MENNFYTAATRSLEAQTSSADRLLDAIRAAMLLSAYTYASGRFHEGWLLAGVAMRLVVSTGIHQIPSCVFKPAPPRNPLLRNKVFVLPPPEDALELAERIHTLWVTLPDDQMKCADRTAGLLWLSKGAQPSPQVSPLLYGMRTSRRRSPDSWRISLRWAILLLLLYYCSSIVQCDSPGRHHLARLVPPLIHRSIGRFVLVRCILFLELDAITNSIVSNGSSQ